MRTTNGSKPTERDDFSYRGQPVGIGIKNNTHPKSLVRKGTGKSGSLKGEGKLGQSEEYLTSKDS